MRSVRKLKGHGIWIGESRYNFRPVIVREVVQMKGLDPRPIEGYASLPDYWMSHKRALRIIERYSWGVVLYLKYGGKKETIVIIGDYDVATGIASGSSGTVDLSIHSAVHKEVIHTLPTDPGVISHSLPKCFGSHVPCAQCDGGLNTLKIHEVQCRFRKDCVLASAVVYEAPNVLNEKGELKDPKIAKHLVKIGRGRFGEVPDPVIPTPEPLVEERNFRGRLLRLDKAMVQRVRFSIALEFVHRITEGMNVNLKDTHRILRVLTRTGYRFDTSEGLAACYWFSIYTQKYLPSRPWMRKVRAIFLVVKYHNSVDTLRITIAADAEEVAKFFPDRPPERYRGRWSCRWIFKNETPPAKFLDDLYEYLVNVRFEAWRKELSWRRRNVVALARKRKKRAARLREEAKIRKPPTLEQRVEKKMKRAMKRKDW